MKFKIYGEEFELDFLDADEMERVEAAIENVQSQNKAEAYEGLTQSQMIRKQCGIIFGFFDEVFGEGTHKRIFKGKCNLVMALNSFEEFIKAKDSSASEVKAIRDKYAPNRAQRRTEQRQHNRSNAPILYNGPKKGKRHH